MAEPEAPTQSRGTHVYPRECQPWRIGKDHGRRNAHAHARDQPKERVTEAGVFFGAVVVLSHFVPAVVRESCSALR